MIKVEYKDGTSEVFRYGDTVGSAAGSYYNHHLQLMDGMKVGKVVKEGTILAYHSGFFTMDPLIGEPVWNTGIPATVAIVNKEVVLEDSCALSQTFADKLSFQTVYDRTIKTNAEMSILKSVKIGDKVKYNDVLMRVGFDTVTSMALDDSEVDEMFDDLNSAEYRAKREGEIVDIQIFYTSDEMSESIKKYISSTNKMKRKMAKYSKGTDSEGSHDFVSKVPIDTRIHGIALNEMDVLVIFYIRSDIGMVAADKASVANQLKTVVGDVVKEPMLTETGIEIDCLFGTASVFNRIVLSTFKTGILNRIVEKAEEDIVELYF